MAYQIIDHEGAEMLAPCVAVMLDSTGASRRDNSLRLRTAGVNFT